MAQLTDDCFAFSGPLLPVDEVERIIRERVMPVAEIETVAISAASGRVIASDVVAPINLPPFDNSAVDGCGLGLSIAQWIATAHGGTLSLESAPGQQTVAKVILPSSGAASDNRSS